MLTYLIDNPGPQPFDKKLSSSATTASAGSQDNSRGPGAVRFSSKLEEIEPSHSLQTLETESTSPKTAGPISPKEQAELRQFSRTLQDSRLQKKRLCDFSFEPVSLPASRVGYYPFHSLVALRYDPPHCQPIKLIMILKFV